MKNILGFKEQKVIVNKIAIRKNCLVLDLVLLTPTTYLIELLTKFGGK